MNDKTSRQTIIRNLVENENIRNQDDLLAKVQANGFDVTQATLSRDLKEMHVAKVHDGDNGYCYRLPKQSGAAMASAIASGNFTEGVTSMSFASSMAVLKTHPGFAPAVASLIDSNVKKVILGTLAGDDTVLIVISDKASRAELIKAISAVLPGIEHKIL